MSKDNIWIHILNQIGYTTDKPFQIITSKEIKDSKATWQGPSCQFEPRLLCKMDNSKSRPQVFQDNNLYLISIKNGTYVIMKENIYVPLPTFEIPPQQINKIHQSLILDIGQSESSMLDNLQHNKVLDQIIGEPVLFGPLLGGRHRCSFDTMLGPHQLEIRGSQYETDGCYETENYICLVEAKSIECQDFNIRQLYYPYREVYNTVGDKKTIIALFIYQDRKNVIHVHKYQWINPLKMMDIVHIGYTCYQA